MRRLFELIRVWFLFERLQRRVSSLRVKWYDKRNALDGAVRIQHANPKADVGVQAQELVVILESQMDDLEKEIKALKSQLAVLRLDKLKRAAY